MADLYKDRWVTCGDEEIRVRWYYLWGTKRIPYRAVHGIKRVSLTATRGKARIGARPTRATGPASTPRGRPSRSRWCSTWAASSAPS